MTADPRTRSGAREALVGVGAEDVDARRFLGRLEQSDGGGVGVVVQHVGPDPDQRPGRFAAQRRVVPVVEVGHPALDPGIDGAGTRHPGVGRLATGGSSTPPTNPITSVRVSPPATIPAR